MFYRSLGSSALQIGCQQLDKMVCRPYCTSRGQDTTLKVPKRFSATCKKPFSLGLTFLSAHILFENRTLEGEHEDKGMRCDCLLWHCLQGLSSRKQ